ncbi:Alpha/Beta hydrolase protein [Mycena vitilis]|nr:Alpha/Beta hydrolase protein [Mycena vitilis]
MENNWLTTLSVITSLLPLPAVVFWKVMTTLHATYNKHRTLRRIIGDSLLRYVCTYVNGPIPESTALDVYEKWTKQAALPSSINELGIDARLLWIGLKSLQHVVLIVHGGGFVVPPPAFHLEFWRYLQKELEKAGIIVGFALLNYTLVPRAAFPTQVDQVRRAVEFLLGAGVQPAQLQIAGDSAGANLIVQLLSHMLHPYPGVPEITLPDKILAVHLLSPWVSLTAETRSFNENDGIDFLSKKALARQGGIVLDGCPEDFKVFAEPAKAPVEWFAGVDKLVDRAIITAGGSECMRDDIIALGEGLKRHHRNVEVVVQEGGFHEDMFLDFLVGEKKLGMLTPLIVDRLLAACSAH